MGKAIGNHSMHSEGELKSSFIGPQTLQVKRSAQVCTNIKESNHTGAMEYFPTCKTYFLVNMTRSERTKS